MRQSNRHPKPRPVPRGVASLVVVVILLAVTAIGVVFTNRNLIVEQKTSANQYRSTIAMEAAEAGLDWATAMMNKPEKVNASCLTSAVAGDVRFRQRFLSVDSSTGALTPLATTGGVHLACVANTDGSAGWSCSCPAIGTAPSPAAAAPATGFQPGFALRFEASTTPGTVRVVSFGCTGRITTSNCDADAAARVSIVLGAIAGLATPPGAPLTARGYVNIGNAALGVHNGDPTTNGITINSGLGIDASNVRITTVPGTPPKTTLVGNDPSLRDTTEDQMFATFFGMSKDAYRDLPSVTKLTCPCTETTISNAYNSGARQIWLDGNLVMNANLTIGNVNDPFVMVVDGTVTMSGNLALYGVIYSTGITWDNTGGGGALLVGAAISEGNYTGNGTPDYVYDPRVMSILRNATAKSYARVPGSWRDF